MNPLNSVPPPAVIGDLMPSGPDDLARACNSAREAQVFASLMAPTLGPTGDEESPDED